jgi:hypothetical protein
VLRPGGRTAFYSIFVSPGLTGRDRRRAGRCGPPAVATASTYSSLLRSAGFVEIVEVDVTAAYLDTARAWLRHGQRFEAELAAQPPGSFADRLARRRVAIPAIEAGLLRRSLFVATRPARPVSRARRHDDRDELRGGTVAASGWPSWSGSIASSML